MMTKHKLYVRQADVFHAAGNLGRLDTGTEIKWFLYISGNKVEECFGIAAVPFDEITFQFNPNLECRNYIFTRLRPREE